jgi:hypothetical protein
MQRLLTASCQQLNSMDDSEFMPTCKTVKRGPFCETPGKLNSGRGRFHPYIGQAVLQHDNVCPLTIGESECGDFRFYFTVLCRLAI